MMHQIKMQRDKRLIQTIPSIITCVLILMIEKFRLIKTRSENVKKRVFNPK